MPRPPSRSQAKRAPGRKRQRSPVYPGEGVEAIGLSGGGEGGAVAPGRRSGSAEMLGGGGSFWKALFAAPWYYGSRGESRAREREYGDWGACAVANGLCGGTAAAERRTRG